ncbi:MAG: M14 family metallopeptidase [Bacteroidota bacterium]
MKKNPLFRVTFTLLLLLLLFAGKTPAQTSPSNFFGFSPGTDRQLFTYEQLIKYLQTLEEESPMLKLQQIGDSPMGRPMYVAFISSEENINNLQELKSINRQLAMNTELGAPKKAELINNGRVFVMVTLSMHANEVAPSQALPVIAHNLVSKTQEDLTHALNKVVYMVVPSHNPDGMNLVVEHYKKYKNTPYEGSRLPGVYHKYVGHDNNRDFVTLTQSDTKAIAKLYNTEWFPQVMIEKHQMGSSGPRYFVSPPHDPIAENVDAGIWNWMKIFGSNAITDMTQQGLKGISHSYLFDDYWPGATETCIWKGIIGMLTEAASVKYATPIYIEPNELKTHGKGMGEYAKSINMPEPWEGGWWHLSDIVNYELASTYSYLKTAARHKDEILAFRNALSVKEVKKGKQEAPYCYIIPGEQHDRSEALVMLELLNEHGVEVHQLKKNRTLNGRNYQTGDYVIMLAQPYRAFIKEVLEKQKFPERHYTANGEMIRPYDITSWSLPLHKGVTCVEINTPPDFQSINLKRVTFPITPIHPEIPENAKHLVLSPNENDNYRIVFSALQEEQEVSRLKESLLVEDKEIPKGSFLLPINKNTPQLLSHFKGTLHFLSNTPEVDSRELKLPKIGIIESWFHHMDAGWTRYLFDNYKIPFDILRPEQLAEKELENYDILIFPSENKGVLLKGKYERNTHYFASQYPPEFSKGMEKKGMQALWKYIQQGGRVVAWQEATQLFMGFQETKLQEAANFELPIKNVAKTTREQGLDLAGTFLSVSIRQDHPLTLGMPETFGVFQRQNPVFQTSFPYFDMDRRVLVSFAEEKIRLSGYAKNSDILKNLPAMVWVKKGKGDLVLFSFAPQFRASTPVTYKLLFNALMEQ